MLYNAKNGTLKIGGSEMDYIRFGTGGKILVMLPGLGDGLRSVKGTALPMAFTYQVFAKDFTVYAFSRKNGLPEGYTTKSGQADFGGYIRQTQSNSESLHRGMGILRQAGRPYRFHGQQCAANLLRGLLPQK